MLEDGIVTPEELEELQIIFTEFVDPVGQLVDVLEGTMPAFDLRRQKYNESKDE